MSRILGIDYGEKRLGFAVGDTSHGIATPLRTVEVRSDSEALEQVREICRETGVETLVVGMPVNMNGTRGPMAERVESFAARLRKDTGLPVDTWDERMTTGIVERAMLEGDLSRAKRKKRRDKLAAQVILQGYMDAQSGKG